MENQDISLFLKGPMKYCHFLFESFQREMHRY